MTHASLFSGIGGPEVAAAMMGWENAFHCEINPFGRAVLEYWFPNSKSYEDITKTDFREWRGKIDILTGGFPCQPFSYAGKRGGREDERYLWPEMLRVIDEVRPTWVVGENVAGITTMVEGGVLTPMGSDTTLFGEGDGLRDRWELRQSFTIERIRRDLEGLGYSVQSMLIPAAAVGAPHRRDRVFILAHASDAESDGGSGIPREQGSEDAGSHSELYAEFVLDGGLSEGTIADPDLSGLQEAWPKLQAAGDRRDCEETIADTNRSGQPASASGDRFNREKSIKGGRSVTFSGTVRPRTSRSFADTYSEGREESQQPGRGEDCDENGTGMDDRTERSGRNGVFADPGLLPENRWRDFPTVSPVHAGNDGLQISLDRIAVYEERNSMDRDSVIIGALKTGKIEVDFESGKIYSTRIRGHEGERIKLMGAECGGYIVHTLSFNGVKKQVRAHQVVWIAANGLYDKETLQIDHINRDRKDNRLSNLRLVTAKENIQNSVRTNTGILTDDQKAAIFQLFHEGNMTMREIAEDFGISKSLVFNVVHEFPSLSIPFGKWRTEALKAYGNAIVPQVMYRIFQAIEKADDNECLF